MNAHSLAKQFLVQKYAPLDDQGGAWISLSMFKTRQEAERLAADLPPHAKSRILEVVCEPTP